MGLHLDIDMLSMHLPSQIVVCLQLLSCCVKLNWHYEKHVLVLYQAYLVLLSRSVVTYLSVCNGTFPHFLSLAI